jgi:hypothetical protein
LKATENGLLSPPPGRGLKNSKIELQRKKLIKKKVQTLSVVTKVSSILLATAAFRAESFPI